VNGADTRACKEGDDRLGDHGQVKSDSVTLLDAHLLEDPSQLGHLAEELAVGDAAALAGLVGLVDDGDLVRGRKGVAVDAVVRGVELALEEPSVVAVLEAAGLDGLEVAVPCDELAGTLGPELVWLLDRLLVELLVFVKTAEMGLAGVLPVRGCGLAEGLLKQSRTSGWVGWLTHWWKALGTW